MPNSLRFGFSTPSVLALRTLIVGIWVVQRNTALLDLDETVRKSSTRRELREDNCCLYVGKMHGYNTLPCTIAVILILNVFLLFLAAVRNFQI
jgi:hypothetical protein